MQDKDKIIKFYSDTKLDMSLLNQLLKRRELKGEQEVMEALVNMQYGSNHAMKILIVPRDNVSQKGGEDGKSENSNVGGMKRVTSRLTITP